MTLKDHLVLHNISIIDKPEMKDSSRVLSIVTHKAQSMVNHIETLDTKPDLPMFKRINMLELRERVGLLLSFLGECAVCYIPYKTTGHLIAGSVVDYKMKANELEYIKVQTEGFHTHNKEDHPIQLTYEFVPGVDGVVLTHSIDVIDEDTNKPIFISQELIESELIPVTLFKNSPYSEPDVVKYSVADDLEKLATLDNLLISEYNRSRSMPYVNTIFGDSTDATEFAETIDDGSVSVIVDDNPNSKLGASKAIIAPNQGVTLLLDTIDRLESDIYRKLGLNRDGTQDGKNRHGLEVVLQDAFLVETLQRELKRRQFYWNDLFDKLNSLVGKSIEAPKNKLSLIEQAKIDMLKATIEAEKAKSKPQPIMQGNKNPKNKEEE